MNKKQRFFINGILASSVGIAMRTVQLIFSAFISRAVGAEGVGLNALIMTVYSFAVTLATSGISLTVTRLVASAIGEGREGDSAKVLRGAVAYALLFSSVTTLGLLLLSGWLGGEVIGDLRSISALRILSFSLIPIALSSVISGYFVGVRRVGANAAVQVAGQIIRIGLTVFLLLRASHLGVEGAIVALAVGSTLTEVACLLLVLAEYFVDRLLHPLSGRARGAELSGVARMALPLAVSAYIRSLLLSVEHNLIPRRLSARGEGRREALASYGALHGMALPMILYPMSPLSSFAGLLVPEFAESLGAKDKNRMSRIATAAMNRTLAFATATAALIYLFSEELGYTVYSSYDAGRYIALLAPVIPIMYLDHVTDSVLKGIGEQVFSMWVNIADAAISVVLVFVLIPVFGISGYAFVIIGMEGFNYLLSVIRLRRRVSFTIDPVSSIAVPLMSAVGASALSLSLFSEDGSATSVLFLALRLVFALAAFFALYIPLSSLLPYVFRRVWARLCHRSAPEI